jgi:hypothetical protein
VKRAAGEAQWRSKRAGKLSKRSGQAMQAGTQLAASKRVGARPLRIDQWRTGIGRRQRESVDGDGNRSIVNGNWWRRDAQALSKCREEEN